MIGVHAVDMDVDLPLACRAAGRLAAGWLPNASRDRVPIVIRPRRAIECRCSVNALQRERPRVETDVANRDQSRLDARSSPAPIQSVAVSACTVG